MGLASRPDERFRIRFRSLAMKLAVSIALLLSSSIVATTAAQVSRPAALPGDELVAAAAGDQRTPVLSAGSDSILAVWQDQRSSPMTSGQQSGFDLFAVRLDALGLPIDPLPFPITMAGGLQSTPRVAWNGSAWLVAWVGQVSTEFYYTDALLAVRVAADGTLLDSQPIVIVPDMVPHPDLLVAGLLSTASGGLTLGATWPASVPPGTALYLQAWIADAAAPAGLSASNGLQALTP